MTLVLCRWSRSRWLADVDQNGGCPRPPIAIKTAGMRLYEMAGRYDRGAIEFGGGDQ